MIKQKIEYRRGLSLLLTVLMCLSMVNLSVFAEEGAPTRCGLEEHTHSIENGCYKLTCDKEIGAGAVEGHTHTDDCYTIETSESPICGKEIGEGAVEGHTHTDACYDKVEVPGEIICEEEHEHTDACSRAESTWEQGGLICGKEVGEGAVEGHTHTDACYKTEVLTCGKEVGEGAVEGHQHKPECYAEEPSCNKTEHEHQESCYAAPACTCEVKCAPNVFNDNCLVCNESPDKCQGTCTDHQWKEEVTQEATATEAGKKKLTCILCGATETREIPPLSAFSASFDFETGTLTINGTGELTKEIVDSFQFESDTLIEGFSGGKSMGKFTLWRMNVPWTNEYEAGLLNHMVKKVVIGDGITAIGERALGGSGYANANYSGSGSRSMRYVKELVLPEGLTEIGESAFSMMGQAGNDQFIVNFPSALEYIGKYAFNQCRTLPKDFVINNASGLVIENQAFRDCNFTSVTINGAQAINDYAFESANGMIESVTISNVGTVGRAFGWHPVTKLTMTNVDTISELAFWGVNSLEEVTLTNVKDIGKQAFIGCSNLEDVTLNNVDMIGAQVFQQAGRAGTRMTLTNIGTIGTYAFWHSDVKNVTMDNVDTIGQYAFYEHNALESVNMGKVGTISQYAFHSCGNLTTIDSLAGVDRIDGFAFYGCSNLSGLTVEDLTKMGFNGNYGDVMERVQAILSGRFKLDSAPGIVELTPDEGWDDSKTARSENWNTYDNGTQLVEQARWTNPGTGASANTEAEVKVDAYYTGKQQMDYIFVADLSSSMAQLGNAADMNSRFYDMQSKLLDMTGQLLGSEGYDCRVAIVTFGGYVDANNLGTSTVMDFTADAADAKEHIAGLEPLYENTDYGLGMQEALKLAQGNGGRNTVVIFLSDGAPNQNGSGDMNGTTAAAGIKALNVPIYGVLHSPGAAHDAALAKMQAVCGDNTVFEATDTESFGKAMNDAFTAVYGDYTVAIPVNEAFENVRDLAVSVTGGEAAYDEESHSITWTITGMPFTKHTLTYKMGLTKENADRTGEQSYPVNSGNAFFGNAGGASVETPVLTRTVSATVDPGPGPDPVTRYNLTIHYVYEGGETAAPTHSSRHDSGYQYSVSSPSIEGYTPDQAVVSGTLTSDVTVTVVYTAEGANIPDENPPLAELPDENPPLAELPDEEPPLAELPEVDIPDEQPPLAENPEVDIPDEDVPLDSTPKTGDDSHTGLWAGLCAVSLLGAVVFGRKEENEQA